jgi:hypothetical protein
LSVGEPLAADRPVGVDFDAIGDYSFFLQAIVVLARPGANALEIARVNQAPLLEETPDHPAIGLVRRHRDVDDRYFVAGGARLGDVSLQTDRRFRSLSTQ